MSKHTPEPWVADDRHDLETNFYSDDATGSIIGGCQEYMFAHRDIEERRANARRIVTCINACAGMADPAAEIAELKRQRDAFQLEAVNCHEMLCVEIERVTNLIAELGFVSEYATKSVMGFCKGDEKSIFDFSKFMEGIFNRYDVELSTECEALLNEGKFTKPKNNLN